MAHPVPKPHTLTVTIDTEGGRRDLVSEHPSKTECLRSRRIARKFYGETYVCGMVTAKKEVETA